MNHKISKIHKRIAIAAYIINLSASVISIADLGVLRACPLGDRLYCQAQTERVTLLRLMPALFVVGTSMLVMAKAGQDDPKDELRPAYDLKALRVRKVGPSRNAWNKF
jgi:hypothetical protein